MNVEGKGTVMLNCKLSDGTVSQFTMENVLSVPKLSLPLFSWRIARSKGFSLCDDGNFITVSKDNRILFEVYFYGPLPSIPEAVINDHALTTYEFWHKALCQSAPSTITSTEKLLPNSSIIPKKPSDFSCEACIVSKSTHKKPKPSQIRAEEKGEHIHSDLCGPFPTPSYGNAVYYICFVDDATRYASVQILKCKSEAAQATIKFIMELKTQC